MEGLAEVRERDKPPCGANLGRTGWPMAVAKAIRPHQWVKNVLVFVPMLAVGDIKAEASLVQAGLAFLALCLTASAVYVGNDLMDLQADRLHHRKRFRPFAHGDLSAPTGLALAPPLLLGGLGLAWAAGVAGLVFGYAVMSILYSAKLKEYPLVDVFVLAALYTIRIVIGGVATGHPASLWLLGFSCFMFLALAFIKRVAELRLPSGRPDGRLARRGYDASDAGILPVMGVASSFASAMVLALYVMDLSRGGIYHQPALLLLTVPLLLFWQCRLWLATMRGRMHDDPIVSAAKDWVSWGVGGAIAVIVLLAHVLPAAGAS